MTIPMKIAGALAAGMLVAAGTVMNAEEKPVDVLVLSAGMKIDPQFSEQFAKEHVNFVVRKISDPLSAEMLRKFHVVVIADWEGPSSWFFPKNFVEGYLTTIRNLELLQEYVRAGGGFFFTPIYGTQVTAESLSKFLEPYGAGVRSAQIRDDAHAYSSLKKGEVKDLSPDDYFEYAWTTAITPHPATQGVERLFYPTSELRWDDLYSTPIVTLVDPAWTALVKGMDTSRPSKGV
ncbi:MAG: hypothetical protein HY770_04625, partial [Chitinivibrionia bacterium]|nr:hypothetical protein [Chitinivibrionia bacterium]